MRRPYSQYLTATNILVAINVVVFFLTGAGSSRSGLELYFTENPNFSYTQYLSHMFMHGSVNHLLFNMFGLWMFGKWLEKLWGAKRFVIFYLLSGIGAAVIYMFYNEWQFNGAIESVVANSAVTKDQLLATISKGQYFTQHAASQDAAQIFDMRMVGASGALYGILVAFAWMFPNFKMMLIFLPVPIAAKIFVPALIALDLFSEFTGFTLFGGNVAHLAHVGGAIVGALLMWFWYDKEAELIQRFR